MCSTASASSAATPGWYPQLKIAVADAGDVGTAISACKVPQTATPKAGRVCAMTNASDDSSTLDRVSVYAETGAQQGPCKRLAFALDHVTVAAASKALDFATQPTTTVAKDVSGRRALAQAARDVTRDFTALRHCLGAA